MFKKSIALSVLVLSVFASSAFAEPTRFVCDNVGGTEEWRIMIDLDEKKAGFFDNDTTVTVPFKTMRLLESIPPQMQYTFEGRDTAGRPGDVLRITFNATRLKASVTMNVGKVNQKSLEALDGCRADRF